MDWKFKKIMVQSNFLTNRSIKSIIFDFDETLVHTRPHVTNFIQDYLAQHYIVLSKEQAMAAGRWSSKFWDGAANYHHDTIINQKFDSVTFWLKYLQQYYAILGSPPNSLDDLFLQMANEIEEREREKFIPPETIQSLNELRSAGFRMGVLSNRILPIAPFVEDFALGEFFECSYSAGELGASKPDRAIFQKYIEKFGGTPEESIYVGDNYWLDVKGAGGAGLQPVLLDMYGWYDDPPCPVIQDLSELVSLLDAK